MKADYINAPTVPDLLNAAAMTYEERGRKYGDSYRRVGEVMKLLFPDPMSIDTSLGYNRFVCLSMVVQKLCRYAQSAQTGPGDADSLTDLSVYAQMLRTLDNDLNDRIAQRTRELRPNPVPTPQEISDRFGFKSAKEAPKRGRGRPRKEKNKIIGSIPPAPKRGRGRPRKNPK